MTKGLFVKKSIKSLLDEVSSESKNGLRRALGPVQLTAMGIGAIIGAGIFVLTGQAAAEYAGPAIMLSFVVAALICVFAALCYAEFASLIPISGSAYSYAYATMGEFTAWIIGWCIPLEFLFSGSTIAVGWSAYFASFCSDLGMPLSSALINAPLKYDVVNGWQASGALFNLPAMIVIALMGILVATGIRLAAGFNSIMVMVKIGVILLFIVCGIGFVKAGNWTPFIPENTGVFGEFGWSGILRGAGVVFFAFIGFDALATLAQESRNPQKDLPRSMLGSLGISTMLYMIMGLVLTGMVSYKSLNVPDPIAVAVDALGPSFLWLRFVIKGSIIAGMTTGILVMIMAQSRVVYTMAHDGLLPAVFGKIHHKHRTPFFTTIVVTIVGMLMAGLFPVGILGQLVSMGTLLIFAIVCFGVLVLRFTQPLLHRPFKVPFAPWIPLFGVIACVVQMLALPGVTWLQFIIWLAIGVAIYYYYGRHHSKVRNPKKK